MSLILNNQFESGTQLSGVLDMSTFHKMSITKCSRRKLRY